MSAVHVAGVGIHPFGRFEDRTITDMGVSAVRAALAEAGISGGGFQAAFCATAYGGGIDALYSSVAAENCTVVGNKANGTAIGEGGGIYGYGSVLTLVATNVMGTPTCSSNNDR